MKFLISVILFMLEVGAVDLIEAPGNNRYTSPLLIDLAAQIGCANGCIHVPQSVIELPVCLAATLGDKNMTNLFLCGSADNTDGACGKVQDPADNTKFMCEWWELAPYYKLGTGICIPKTLSQYKTKAQGVLSAFYPLVSGNGRSYKSFMSCLAKSKGTCAGGCQMCDGIPSHYFPMDSPLTKLCIPNWEFWYPAVCPALSTQISAPKYCPGKSPFFQALLAEMAITPCYKESCPKTECPKTRCPDLKC